MKMETQTLFEMQTLKLVCKCLYSTAEDYEIVSCTKW